LVIFMILSSLTYARVLPHYGKVSTNAYVSLSPNWVLWLKFDEGFGNKVYDSTIYGNNGTLYNACWKDEAECKQGKCLYFDGNDYVEIPNSDSLNISKEITIEVWVKPTATGFRYLSLFPVKDGYINEKSPGWKPQNDWGIWIGENCTLTGIFGFDTFVLNPASILNAIFSLRHIGGSYECQVLCPLNFTTYPYSWSEDNISYDTAPGFGDKIGDCIKFCPPRRPGGTASFNLTNFVNLNSELF